MTLEQHNPWPALEAASASCLLAVLGLMRAYRLTLRFYQGAEDQLPTRSGLDTQKAPARTALLVQRRLPFLPDDTAALALATFRSLSRAPEIKMALIMPIVAGAALTSLPLRKLQNAPPETLTSFAVTVVALLSVFAFAPVMGNAFGLDRNGFRALVLLPTPRQRILLAKNLAFLPLVTGVGLVLLTLVAWIFRMTWGAVLAGLLQILITFFSFCLAGNLTSVLVPYRMALGTLQAKKPKPIVFLATAIAMLVMPIVLSPAVIPPALQLLWSFVWGVPWWFSVNLVASLIVLIAVGWLYWFVLPSQGRLLQRREQAILREVTEELE